MSDHPRVDAAWDALEASLTHPLPKPAPEELITHVEGRLGVQLPADLRASLLRHDGVREGTWPRGWLLSTEEILGVWETWTELQDGGDFDGRVDEMWESHRAEYDQLDADNHWFHPAWLPVASDGAGNDLCVDARTGQLVDMDHEVGPTPAGFASFTDYLERIIPLAQGDEASGPWA